MLSRLRKFVFCLLLVSGCLFPLRQLSATEGELISLPVDQEFDLYQGAIPIRQFTFEYEDDRDYDRQPDDWIRRQGIDFRQYVISEIDYEQHTGGQRSLRIDANGSGAIYYSAPIPIDAEHSYVMQASVLTRGLKYDAAVVSFSFLNHRKQRVQRVVTPPVSGTHKSWIDLKIPPLMPQSDVKFVVVGCHLIHSEQADLTGSAWFDDISISKLPYLNLASNFETHFRESNSNISILSRATGLDQSHQGEQYQYELQLAVEDVNGKILDSTSYQMQGAAPASTAEETVRTEELTTNQELIVSKDQTEWQLPVYPPGYYRVRANLLRNQLSVVQRTTSFAVLNLNGKAPKTGEFGWNLAGAEHHISPDDLLAITRESGINWVKTPVWKDAYSHDPSQLGQFMTSLRNQSINPIGMLSDPPPGIRKKYSEDWTGISELFVSPPIVWREGANQVMALYSPTITRWQLGDDADSSFVGMPDYNGTMEKIRRELQRIGQIRQLGVRWNVGSEVPQNKALNRNFLTLLFDQNQTVEAVSASVQKIHAAGYEAWVVVKANDAITAEDPFVRANQLVRRLVDAKRTGCDLIFSYDVFHPEYGLLQQDGSPSELFLPWRTVALALNDSQYAGSIQMPNNSENHVFLRENDAVIVLWSKEPIEEEIYLGDDVTLNTVWGDRRKLQGNPRNGRQSFTVTSVPLILTGCSKEMVKWRMDTRFEIGRIASSLAEQEDRLLLKNSFPWNVQGTISVSPDNGWEVNPPVIPMSVAANAEVAIPMGIKLPSSSNLGDQMMAIEFNLGGAGLSHPFRVFRNYQVGLGDVHMEIKLTRTSEGLIIDQLVTNKTEPNEVLDLRCHLLIRGRRRQTKNLDGLLSGQTYKATYFVREFEQLESKDLWLRAEQKNGRRNLNEILNAEQVYRLIERTELETELQDTKNTL